MEILNTRLYQADKDKEDFWETATKSNDEKIEVREKDMFLITYLPCRIQLPYKLYKITIITA